MNRSHAHTGSRNSASKRGAGKTLPLVIMSIGSVLLAGTMAFGNGSLWLTQDQLTMSDSTVEVAETGVISSYKASTANNDEARIVNLTLSSQAIDGTVIQPGETLSFNEAVGETTKEKGYQKAPVIIDGEETNEYGGGVCQVSTAVYIAAVEANLEIVERHAHSTPPDYAPVGLDAAVYYGFWDLRIRNNTDKSITLHVSTEGQTVTAYFEGELLPEGVSVEAVSGVTGDYTMENEEGEEERHYQTKSYRLRYEDGVLVDRENLAIDYYLVTDETILNMGSGSVAAVK